MDTKEEEKKKISSSMLRLELNFDIIHQSDWVRENVCIGTGKGKETWMKKKNINVEQEKKPHYIWNQTQY